MITNGEDHKDFVSRGADHVNRLRLECDGTVVRGGSR